MGDERYPSRGLRSNAPTETKVSERHAKIWATIADTYGNRWNKSYGALPPHVWCQMFNSLTDQQIQQAILKLVEHYPHHPPTLGEFVEMARLGISREAPLQDKPRDPVEDMSPYACKANVIMMKIGVERGGFGGAELKMMLAEKKRLVEQYEVMDADEDTEVDWEGFLATMDERLRTVLKEGAA